ncbi:MAG: DNA alkylation repair protein [Patescibacteria group bacterium]
MSEFLKLRKELRSKASPEKAKILRGFFKTDKGEYGEGDVFLGVIVPEIRKIVKKYAALKLTDAIRLLHSKIHEERLTALLMMVQKFETGRDREKVYRLYLKNTKYINNWDLVDLSAHKIVGEYLRKPFGPAQGKNFSILMKLARSRNFWERRIAVLATFNFIKDHEFTEFLKIAGTLLNDKHDLIQKAVGWMLREVGKRDLKAEERFLKQHYKEMPRTMLRYAIERLPGKKRKWYL